jgi:threonine dehydrogenase-like Zn-dependent dehydrogenase
VPNALIAIDTVPERLALAKASGAITLDFLKEDINDRIQERTSGRGADACIDAVGTEPETKSGFDAVVDRVKIATFMGTDRPHVLRQAIHCCRNFGDGLDRRRLWRLPRQDSDGLRNQSRTYLPGGTDAGPALLA